MNLEEFLKEEDFSVEMDLIERSKKNNKQTLILYNSFRKHLEISDKKLNAFKNRLDQKAGFKLPSLLIDATRKNHKRQLVDFIKSNFKKESRQIDLLPGIKDGYVMLIIPMDEETPTLRLLRPQDMAVERLLRNYCTPVLFRLDLDKARVDHDEIVESEKNRFLSVVENLMASEEGLKLIITDSQAFDLLAKWAPSNLPMTSFSIMMANYMSFGEIDYLVKSVEIVDDLHEGDKILITEACNHDRKCNDIATVQIPRLLQKKAGCELDFDFNFGKPFPQNVCKYKLIIHCGGCMIDRQKFSRRLNLAKEAGVGFTNYGILFSYFQSKEFLLNSLRLYQ